MEEKDAVRIRPAAPADAEALLAIYAPYVHETAITFEYEVPGAAEFAGRIENTLKKYPYLVAERGGEPLGYAYADRSERLPEARQLIEKALALAPDDAAILDSMGWVLFRQGDLPGALSYLERS